MITLLVLAALLLISRFILCVTRVKGRSMLPTLKNGDLLIVCRLFPRNVPCRRGDIVICHYPHRLLFGRFPQRFVKRVVGLPGEHLAIRQGELFINGESFPEPYLDPVYAHLKRSAPERLIGRHRYFVMGDHRDNSNDSRSVGTLHRQDLVGRVIGIIHVPSKFSTWLEKLDSRMDAALRKGMRKAGKRRPFSFLKRKKNGS